MPNRTRETRAAMDAVVVLLVDDDEGWAWATKRLLERRGEGFSVETAHTVAGARERFADLDPDCVVCDYRLENDTGFAVLETVREADPRRPFVLVTGQGNESVASDAIGRGVTDYIRKGHDDEGELLASRVRNAVRTYRSERALERERRSKNAVLDSLTEATGAREFCQQFCRQLTDGGYALAWIGTGSDRDGPVPRAAAGREAYLDDLFEGGIDRSEPATRALNRDSPVIVSPVTDGEGEAAGPGDGPPPWRHLAGDHGFESVVAAPIRYDDVAFGVLAVYVAGDPVGDAEADVVEEYAESIGYALRSLERKRSLLSDRPVRVEVQVEDPAAPLVALAERLPAEARLAVPSAVPRDDGTVLYLASVEGVDDDALDAAVDATASLSTYEDGSAADAEFVATAPTPEEVLVDHGARFERTVVADEEATVSVYAADDGVVSGLSRALTSAFDDAVVSTIWTDRGDNTTADDPFDDLTDKQRMAVRHAYHAGYFEQPRRANATEVAERLGVARQTFAQHLRAAQRKVFGTWQSR